MPEPDTDGTVATSDSAVSRADPQRVAVVIPSYNHGHYLEETIQSVLAQTRRPDRILILDDGSADDSLEVARSFSSHGVEVEAQENAGAHVALNRLVAKAARDCGTIAILNSDDHFLPDRLATCLAALETNPRAELICTPLELIDDDGRELSKDHPRSRWFASAWSPREEGALSLASWLGMANFPATTSNIVARSAFLSANPMRDYRFCHDYFLLASAAIAGSMVILPGPAMLQYRVHASNTITTTPEVLVREMARMRLELAHHLAPAAETNPTVREHLADFLQASWGNISSIPEAEVQLALALSIDLKTISQTVAAIPAARLASFPNRAILNARPVDAIHPIGRGPELARQVEALGKQRNQLKKESTASRKLAQTRHRLARSRWIALGTVLGCCPRLHKNDGSSPEEKLAKLEAAIAESRWVGLGARFGSGTCKDLC